MLHPGVSSVCIATALLTACGGTRPSPRGVQCDLAVVNRTAAALDIRVATGWGPPALIGGLNPGELLTHSVPCAHRRVWVVGVPITATGVTARAVAEGADLEAGRRVVVTLHWP